MVCPFDSSPRLFVVGKTGLEPPSPSAGGESRASRSCPNLFKIASANRPGSAEFQFFESKIAERSSITWGYRNPHNLRPGSVRRQRKKKKSRDYGKPTRVFSCTELEPELADGPPSAHTYSSSRHLSPTSCPLHCAPNIGDLR